jgi:hypothetical protein
MDFKSAKVLVESSITQSSVYGALSRAGIDTGQRLTVARANARGTGQAAKFELINAAINRLQQIENGEI